MKNMRKIGWQKYEDYIEKQISSPVLMNIIQNIAALQNPSAIHNDDDEEEDNEADEDYEDIIEKKKTVPPFLPLNNQIIDEISMLTSFDCWIGHTNFDLTQSIKNTLDNIPGIELLKIYSRYRFFVGIGKMFDFTEVRKTIEDALIGEN